MFVLAGGSPANAATTGPGRLGDGAAEEGRLPGAVIDGYLDLLDPAIRCPGQAVDVHQPGRQGRTVGRVVDPRLGQDRAVLRPARFTQYALKASRVVSSISESHLVADT